MLNRPSFASLFMSKWCALGVYLNGSGPCTFLWEYLLLCFCWTVWFQSDSVKLLDQIMTQGAGSRSILTLSVFWSCCFKLVFFPIIFKLMDDQFVVIKTSHFYTHSGEHFLLAISALCIHRYSVLQNCFWSGELKISILL